MFAYKLVYDDGHDGTTDTPRDSARSGEAIVRLMDTLGPTSVAWIVRLPHAPRDRALRRPQGDLAAAVDAALSDVMMEPCEAAIVEFSEQVVAAVLTPRSGRALDPMQVHAMLALFRSELCTLLDLADAEEAEQPILLPLAAVDSVDDLRDNISALNELLETIIHKQLRVQFQPIIHFASARVYGYESLIRVPQDGNLKRPGQYF